MLGKVPCRAIAHTRTASGLRSVPPQRRVPRVIRITRPPLLAIAACVFGAALHAPVAAQSPARTAPSPASRVVAEATAAWVAGMERAAAEAWRDTLAERPDATHAWLSLAVLAREAFDWTGADSLQQRARVALTRDARVVDQRDAFAAIVWLETARSANARGEYRHAAQAVDSSIAHARAARDSVTLASALASAAALRGRTVSAVAQQATLDSLAPLTQFRDSLLQLRDRCVRAASTAMRDLDRMAAVLSLARGAHDARASGVCLFTAATLFSERGLQYSTSVLLDSALVSFRRGRAPVDEAAVLQWLGNLYARSGQYALADRYLSEALRGALAADNRSLTAWIHLNLATTARGRGDRARAERSVLLARTLAETVGDGYALADADASYARILLEDEDWPALESHLAAGEGESRPLAATASRFTLRADMALRRGDLSAARTWLMRTDSIATLRGPNWRPSVALNHAWLELRSGRARVAATTLDTLRFRFGRAQVSTQLFVGSALAEAHLALGEVDSAIAALDDALAHIDTRVQEEPTNRLRAQAANTQQPFGGARAADAPRAAVVGIAKAGRVDVAFAQSERLRARALLEALLLAAPVNEETAAERAVRRAEQYAPATLASAQAALPDDRTALVSFLTGPADVGTVALVVTRGDVRAVSLPSVDSLAPLIQRLTAALSDGANDRRLRALRDGLAQQLGDALLAPVLTAVPTGTRHLVIIADDILHRVPFSALRPGGRPLPKPLALSTVPSAAVAELVWRGRDPIGVHSVVLASPVAPIEGDPNAVWRVPLRGAHAEGHAVAGLLHASQLFTGAEASEAQLRAVSDDPPAVLHIAAHAEVNDQEVDDGLLILSSGRDADGFVTPAELATLRLTGTLVVLSGCRTARGPIVGGEGVRGLVPPLLTAGAAAVLTTQWDVGDEGLAPLMTAFYRALTRGHTAAEALRLVQVEAQANNRPSREWAALTLVGNGNWRLPPAARTSAAARGTAKIASRSF